MVLLGAASLALHSTLVEQGSRAVVSCSRRVLLARGLIERHRSVLMLQASEEDKMQTPQLRDDARCVLLHHVMTV